VSSYRKSLDYAKNLAKNNEKLIFHCFWRVPKEFGRKQVTVLKSIIVTQKNVEINLWSNVDLSNNEYFQEVSKYVIFKKWDLMCEIKGTILENTYINNDVINDSLCYLEGDLFRLLILNKYGGFYIDMDVLVLEDITPLNQYEFQYQWGTSGFNHFEPHITINGAIMRLNKNSKLSEEFLRLMIDNRPSKNTTSWGNSMYSKIKDNDLWVLPGIWFNSEWGFEGTENNPFKKVETVELFDGAFTWHWHNKWDDPIEIGSKFYYLEEKINKEFKEFYE
jgi:hypothetical protein